MATTTDEGGSQGPLVNTVAICFAAITFVVLSLRLFSRACITNRLGVDDYLIVLACLLSWAFIVATVMAVEQGLGSHYSTFTDIRRLERYLEVVYFSAIFYNATLGFIKASVLALYMRLGDPWLRRLAMIMLLVVSMQALANCCAAAFQCSPIRAAWDLSIKEKTCINTNAFYLANAALNIFTDLLTYTLPIRLVFDLQLPQKQKIILGIMLGLGFFACLSSIIRITYIPAMLTSSDPTYVIAPAMYWSVIETNVGILAASIPSFKAVAQRYLPRLIGEYASSSPRSYLGDNTTSQSKSKSGNLGRKIGTGSAARHSKAGFSKFGTANDEIPLQSVSQSESVVVAEKFGAEGRSRFRSGSLSSTSDAENRRSPPDGKIMTETHITMSVEDRV